MVSRGYLQLDLLAVGCALLLVYFYYAKRNRCAPLPPGPKPLPIIGNMMDLPKEKDWETYNRWAKQYGDVVYLRTPGTSIVILNTFKAVNELLERRSSIYSDRPRLVMLREMIGFNGTASHPYGGVWRKHRLLYHQQMNSIAVQKFQDSQMVVVRELLKLFLESPQDYVRHIRYMAASLAMSISYGRDLASKFDQYVSLSERNAAMFVRTVRPGAFLVDTIPMLKHVPAWFPGAGFKEFAKQARRNVQLARDVPFADVKQSLATGNARASFVSNSLTDLGTTDESNQDVDAVKNVAAGIFAAGSDTTTAALHWFMLAMTLYPEIQKRAQTELDSVVGDRLPLFTDRPYLPYVCAVVKEVFRWFPVTPTGLPHLTTEEDVYEGYRIPARSIVLANSWNILHDPEMYPNPFTFDPIRFLPDKEGKMPRDPAISGAFGFGRRICAGRHLADASVWMAVASILTVFNITQAVDKDGYKIDVSYAMDPRPGFFSHPRPFPCSITPRSEEAEIMIRRMEHM